jgi:hypothetical protein
MQKFAGLFAVFDHDSNFVAFTATNNYTVDWGDGSATEDIATGVTAQHQYTYASISASTLSNRGYKQVIITVVPQAGQNLNSVTLAKKHSSAFSQTVLVGWLDVACSCTPNSTDGFFVGLNTLNMGYLEQCVMYNGTARTSILSITRDCIALKRLILPSSLNAVTNASTAFYNSGLEELTLPSMPNVTSMASAFSASRLKKLTLTGFNSLTTLSSIASSMPLLEELTINAPAAINIITLANTCPKLRNVNLAFGSLVTTTTSMFLSSPNITNLVITGLTVSFSVTNLNLSATALNTLFTGLPTVTGSPSVTITGCPGASTCDQTIATSKGWTVTN